MTLSEHELDEKTWTSALEKWYIVFSCGHEARPAGYDFEEALENRNLHDTRSVFGNRRNRSLNTVLKRGSSMVRFIIGGLAGVTCHRTLSALQPADIDAYMSFLSEQGAGASAFTSLLEALKFCYHCLGIGEGPMPISLRAKKHVELSDTDKRRNRHEF
jgi:hypothetical protein